MDATLSKLFRDIEHDLGTHQFCIVVLEAIKDALGQYKIHTRRQFDEQLLELFTLLQATKPRYAILLDSFYKILEAEEKRGRDEGIEILLKEIDRIGASYQLEKLAMVQVSQAIGVDGKNILIHDHSHSVHDVLRAMKNANRSFAVTVAEQALEKTGDNIRFLHEADIPYKVVPAHMLSHIDKTIDMVFCGAMTYQENHSFVMDPGSKAIISHFHLEKKPVYIFITTSKLTLWPLQKKSHEVYAKSERRRHHAMVEIEFEHLKFSHDRVAAELVDHVVTEQAIHSSQDFKKLFGQLFARRARQQRKFFNR